MFLYKEGGGRGGERQGLSRSPPSPTFYSPFFLFLFLFFIQFLHRSSGGESGGGGGGSGGRIRGGR